MNKQVTKTEKKVHSYIKNNHMLDGCKHVVAGVSGGADSVCLLLMLYDYVKKYCPEVCIHAVHVNHMIRQEAVDDENFTRNLCEELGVSCYVEHIDCEGIAKRNGLTVEEAGRAERYRIFEEIALRYEEDGRTMIAVAHHMNDQAETVIMNMARGTSLKGVRGIVPVRDNICRPLLCITRKQIEEFLKVRQQKYVTDMTNFDNDYTRNAIRNIILPYMCEHINKRAVENISAMACDIREAEEYMDRQADRIYKECVIEKVQNNSEAGNMINEAVIRINAERLKQEEGLLARRVVYKSLVKLAGKAKDIYSVNVSDIAALMDMQTGKEIHSVYGIRAKREYDYIILTKAYSYEDKDDEYEIHVDIKGLDRLSDMSELDKTQKALSSNSIEESQDKDAASLTISIDRDIYIAGEGIKYAKSITFSLIDKNTALEAGKNPLDNGKICVNKSNNDYAKYYDYDKINKLLDIRFRKSQDDIVVSKEGNTKKLKKELVDQKVPSAYREKVLLVCDKNHVLWACGVRRCESFLVDSQTSRVLKILINMKERN